MKEGLILGLDSILALIKGGSTPAQIVKDYEVKKQSLDYYVGKLKKLGCIEKVGYGAWRYIIEVPKRPKGHKGRQSSDKYKKEIRGHAFIWKIQFMESFDWPKIVGKYKKKKLTFQKIARGKVYRTIYNSRKTWLTKNGMIIYEPLDFLGKSSFQVKGTAVFEMDKLIKGILKELGLKFRPYKFTTSREHYAIIKNELARQYNEKKEKLYVRGEDGTAWLWIDNSKGLNELENNEPVVNRQVQKFWNSHKETKFKVGPEFILEGFNKQNQIMQGIQANQGIFDQNMMSHIKAVQELGKGVHELRKQIKNINKLNKKGVK